MWTSSAFRPGAPAGQPARASASRETTAPYRSSRAAVRRASTGGSDTQRSPSRSTPSSSRAGAGSTRASARRRSPSTRARRSHVGGRHADPVLEVVGGRRGRGHAVLEQQEAGPTLVPERLATGLLGGPAHEDDIHGGDRKEGTFRGCFAPVKRSRCTLSARSRTRRGIRYLCCPAHGSPVAPRPPRVGPALLRVLQEGAASGRQGHRRDGPAGRAHPLRAGHRRAGGLRHHRRHGVRRRQRHQGGDARARHLRRRAGPARPRAAHRHRRPPRPTSRCWCSASASSPAILDEVPPIAHKLLQVARRPGSASSTPRPTADPRFGPRPPTRDYVRQP